MKVLKRISLLGFSLFLFSCSADENVSVSDDINYKVPDVISILEKTKNEKKGGPVGFTPKFNFTTESDYIEGNSGCYTVNVRVYITNLETGQKSQVANDDVKVGDCPQNQNKTNNTLSKCDIYILDNGHQIIGNNVKTPYCVAELIDYEIIYNSYEKSINDLLKARKLQK